MSNFIYNKQGLPIAYIVKSGEIYSLDGKALAYTHLNYVYSYNGSVLGFYENGWFIDKNGRYALFTQDSGSNMPKPKNILYTQELRIRQREPLKATRQNPPVKPLLNKQWSVFSDVSFFSEKSVA